jgi:hypothetical protein
MSANGSSRRSFFVDFLSTVAGGWVAIAGLLSLGTSASGCSDDTKSKVDTGPVVKYGGPQDMKVDSNPVVKYGGPGDASLDGQPVVKYGGPSDLRVDGQPTTKYGGPG